MPLSDPMEILLEHDKWATTQILLECEKLTPEQFARKFDMGTGSLQATITHMISAKATWTDTLAERPMRPRADASGIAYPPAELLRMHEESADEFITLARSRPVGEIVKRTLREKEYAFTRGIVITHVTTHGMHHRAQCLNMLKQLGVKPLPRSGVAEWSWIA